MNIGEDAPAIAQGRELQEAVLSTDFCKLFAAWHEGGTLFKNGLSTMSTDSCMVCVVV